MKNILRFNSILAILALILLQTAGAQQLDMDLLKDMEPRNIGPAGMSGRITAIDVIDSDPSVMYAGAASGGLWKSTSGGINWEPIFDTYGAHSIGAVEIYQKNPDIIWVGTGEGNPRNSQSSGAGIYKSVDGGRSWELMGLEATRNIHRVIVHPEDPDVVWVGAQGSAWGDTEDRGVYKTTDGGETWEKVLYVNSRTGIGDMVMDPSNPDKIIAAMWEFRRWPWFFESGGEGSGLYMTLDGGDTWNEITSEDGLPEGDLGRMGVAFAPSEPEIVYAHIESKKNAIYRSEDGGYTWELRQTVEEDGEVGNRPFYYAEIYVDPFNENRVFSIYTYISVSEDGGRSFESLYPYYNWVHPDHHAFWLSKTQKGFMIDGNDGGLNITYDGGKNWRFVDNIPVGQYYHVSVDMNIPYNVYGGMQDNGSWQGPAYVWRDGGIRNAYWEELYFGDGFDVMMDPSDSRYAYAMSQQGNVGRVDLETGTSRFVRPTHPDGENLRFNWNSAINFDPFDDETIYFGSQYVHKSTDRGESWEIISPDLTTNDTTKQRQSESGGLTLDATGAENFTTILAIEPSPVEQGVIWAGTDDGKVHITRDGGENWTDLTRNIKGVPEGSWVSQVKASAFNPGEAFAVINNYRRNDWGVYVLHTDNYGRSWTNIARDKGLEGYALSFVQDPVSEDLMFIGTELGLYVSIDGGDSWTKWTNGYPTASTYDLVIHPREHDLVIGTFGRSFWVLDDIRPLRDLAMNGADELEKTVRVYEPPTAYLADWRQAAGSRFSADGMYSGENRPNGARITYSVNTEMIEVEEGDDEPEVKVEIFDRSGEQIRSFEVSPENNGINRMTWGLEMKGKRGPSRRLTRENAGEPGGPDVLPGEYMVKLTYGEVSDSTYITVESDPRIEVSMQALRETQELEHSIEDLGESLKEQTDRLLKAMDIIQMNESLAAADERDKEALTEVTAANKETKEKIEMIMNRIFGTPDDRQGIVRNPEVTVMNRLYAVNRYLGNDFDGPGSREANLLEMAEESVNQAILDIQTFFRTEWPGYQSTIEAAELSPFKDL
ncbi:WD40/YVTN/BNR-like repeat-containing protein [Balneola sp. MJW-20]|uniref:WD40/YVTN/BNR-like repeat-containing protein n=1 Tax=Gracilimonas aurantiaca TaxID=3234185 RepID=UPI0034659029